MITEFAFKLNGISLEHMLQLDEATINEAALNNYIYVYCQDDHTVAFGGAVNLKQSIVFNEGEPVGIVIYRYDGNIHAAIVSDKTLHGFQDNKVRSDAYKEAMENAQVLLPENNPALLPKAQWHIKAGFPASEFDIFTGNHLFCRGIVFSTDSIK